MKTSLKFVAVLAVVALALTPAVAFFVFGASPAITMALASVCTTTLILAR